MTPTEIERLARMAASIRPDWPVKSLITALTNFTHAHPERSYPDTAHALLELALDPETQNPGRLAENGPWWKARPGKGDNPRPVTAGPEARFCEYKLVTDEDGQPLRCGRLLDPDGGCDHGITPRPRRASIIAKLRQDIAEAQGIHQRVEGERETLREKAKEDAA